MTFKLLALLGILGATPLGTSATAPLYDLPSDVLARGQEGKRELGKRAVIETVEDVFVFVTPYGAGSLGEAKGITKNVLRAYFNGRFSKRPVARTRPVTTPATGRLITGCGGVNALMPQARRGNATNHGVAVA
jgi:hypothetical protein